MKISRKDWQKYITLLRKVSNTAADKVAKYINTIDIDSEEGINALLDYSYAVATKYGEGATALACQMYDEIASLSGASVPIAEPAATATYGEVAMSVRGKMMDTLNPDAIGAKVGLLVRRAGMDTTLHNAIRDGAEWAWIPSGDTCPFCLVLASNGWQKASKKVLKGNHADHIHANCDCSFVVRFDNRMDVEGYDPEALYDEYMGAAGGNSTAKINALRRRHYAANKDKINTQKRAAYARLQYSKLPDDEGIFTTLDARGNSKQYDVIKPRNLYKNLKKTETGKSAINLIEKNNYEVKLLYGISEKDSQDRNIRGVINHMDKEIWIYVDVTKSIEETAATAVHEAYHLNDYGNCRKSEAYCEVKAMLHAKRQEKLTTRELKDIIKKTNRLYGDLPWRE